MHNDKTSLRKFGITMGFAFLVIAGLMYFKRHYFTVSIPYISLAFFLLAFTFPLILKPLYLAWMKFALVLSWINTRIILCLIFYLLFTPIGLVLRLFGKDLLDRKIEKKKITYWSKCEAGGFNPSDYARQF